MLDGPGRDDGLGADEIVLSDVIPGDSTALLSDHAALAGSGMTPIDMAMPPIDPLAFSDGPLGGPAGLPGALAPGHGASAGGGPDAASGPCGCLSVAYYQPYFDVDLEHVLQRLRCALLVVKQPPFLQVIDGRPDAYGPFWVATTLIFAIAVTSHISSFVEFSSLQSVSGEVFEYDFAVVTTCASVVYGYLLVVPLAFWAAFKYQLGVPLPLIHVLCVVGYSLAPYVPLAALCAVPALEWLALLLSCAASTLFAIKALMPTLMQHIPQQTIVVLGVLMGANVGLMLAVKFGCYA